MNHQDNLPPRTVPMPADLLPLLRRLLDAVRALLGGLGLDGAALRPLADWAATAEHQDVDPVLVGRTGADATAARTARHLQEAQLAAAVALDAAAPPMVAAARVLADVAARLGALPGLTATVHQWDTGVSVHVTVPTARPLEERRQLIAAAQTLGDLEATPYDDGSEITSVTVRDWHETGMSVWISARTADPAEGAEGGDR